MDWGNAVDKLENTGEGDGYSFPSRPDDLGSPNAEEALSNELPYDLESLEESVRSQHVPGYSEEVQNFLDYLEDDYNPESAEFAAVVKVGLHLKGYHIGYGRVLEVQESDSTEKTVYRKATEIKDEIGIEERLEWPEVRQQKPKTV